MRDIRFELEQQVQCRRLEFQLEQQSHELEQQHIGPLRLQYLKPRTLGQWNYRDGVSCIMRNQQDMRFW